MRESYFDRTPTFLRLSIQQPTSENVFISLPISKCFVVLMQEKKHCLISNIENLVANIRSVKFSFSLSISRNQINRGYLFFSVKDRNLFHRVDTIGNIFTSGVASSENITDGVHEMK